MQLGGQPAPGAAQPVVGGLDLDAAGRLYLQIPLLRAPAACWCARVIVESTLTSHVIRPLASALAAAPSRSAPRCRPSANAGTARTPSPTRHTGRARHATAHPSASATGSHR